MLEEENEMEVSLTCQARVRRKLWTVVSLKEVRGD